MFTSIKSAFQLYKINFWQVLLIGMTVVSLGHAQIQLFVVEKSDAND